jgi:hypothetical protein
MGASSGNGAGSSIAQQPQLLIPLVALAAALPALLVLGLWKSVPTASKRGDKERRRGGKGREATAVVIVDPYSSGGVLARLAHDQGY